MRIYRVSVFLLHTRVAQSNEVHSRTNRVHILDMWHTARLVNAVMDVFVFVAFTTHQHKTGQRAPNIHLKLYITANNSRCEIFRTYLENCIIHRWQPGL